MYLRLPYGCKSSYKVAILNNLNLFEVPHFALSVCKSTKPSGLSFAFNAPKIWNDLPDHVNSATSLIQKEVKTFLLWRGILKLVSDFIWSFSVMLKCLAVSSYMIMDFCFSVLYA